MNENEHMQPESTLPVQEEIKKEQKRSALESSAVGIALVLAIISTGIGVYNSFQLRKISERPIAEADQGNTDTVNAADLLNDLNTNHSFLGSPNAKITIVEFGDYQCPFCGRFFTDTFPQIKKDYIDTGKAKFVYVDFAFLGQESKDAVIAAECAQDQGKFWQYHDMLFNNQNGENQGAFTKTKLAVFAQKLGLDMAAFTNCVNSGKYTNLAGNEMAVGRKYGIAGTPAFIINNTVIKGAVPFENFKEVLDGE